MDLQYNLPFSLKFMYGDSKTDSIHATSFYSKKSECPDAPSLEIIENKYISILFDSIDSESRMYLYGLESLSDDRVENDENGDAYINPSSEHIVLYEKDYYPLIPGDYLLKIVANSKWYYNSIRIRPKQVSNTQLALMKEELESSIRGLAIDFVKRVYSNDAGIKKTLPPKILKEYMVIETHYLKVMAALTDLYKRVNFRIRKDYVMTREEKVKVIDMNTIKSSQIQNRNQNFVKAPKSVVNYDLSENRWVKYIVRNVVVILDEFINSVDYHVVNVEKEIAELSKYSSFQANIRNEIIEKKKELNQLKQYHFVVNKMRIGFQIIIHTPWYQEITTKAFKEVPYILLTDSRYRALYQLHRDLKDEEINVSIDPKYMYQWKRTDKLYEMWGFITILRILKDRFGYVPKNGWIYSRDNSQRNFLIPYLPCGESITLTKGEWTINLVYDAQLPLSSDATKLKIAPLYLGKNNRPDGRIDFYKKEVYAGSLIFDFKYRPISNFWRTNYYDSMKRLKEMDQIIAYKRDSNSKFLYGEIAGKKIRDLHSPRPVREAWAIYAEADDNKRKELYFKEDSIRLIPLNPGDDDLIEKNLINIINLMENVLDQVELSAEN